MSEIKFFGEIDLHPTKHFIRSEYPAWYFDRALDQVTEDIRRMERVLEKGELPSDKIVQVQDRLDSEKKRRDEVMNSMPKLSGEDKDRLAKSRKEMAKIIQTALFGRSSMQKGTADAHKEAERMIMPKIDVRPEFVDLVKACNVPITDGKITRDGLIKTWKITGKLLNHHGGDEETNVEVLRRD